MRLLAKLRSGVLEIAVGDECRYAKPSFLQRAYLIWTFRNFRRLSVRVLNQSQCEMVEHLSQTATAVENKKIDPTLTIGRIEFAAFPARKVLIVESASGSPMLSRLPSVNKMQRLRKLPWSRAHQPAAANSPRGITKTARYSLTLGLAAASLIVLSGALAQRLWIKHHEAFPINAPSRPVAMSEAAHTKAGMVSVALAETSRAMESDLSHPATPAALQLPRTISSSPDRAKVIPPPRVAADKALSNGTVDLDSRPRVFLAPRNVVYPSIPDSGLSGNEKKQIYVKAFVNGEGLVDDVQVPGQASSLATAIAKTVRKWRYEPYRLNGRPVEVETRMIFTVLGPDAITVRFLPASENVADN